MYYINVIVKNEMYIISIIVCSISISDKYILYIDLFKIKYKMISVTSVASSFDICITWINTV